MGAPADHRITTRSRSSTPARLDVTSPLTRPPVPRESNSSRGRVSSPRSERGAPTPQGGGAEEREPTGREAGLRYSAGRAQRGRVGSLHRSSPHRSATGIRLPRVEQQRGSDLAARSNADRASHVYCRCPVLPRDGKRGPFGFSRWGRGKRLRAERGRAKRGARVSASLRRTSILSFFLPPPGATATAFLPPPGTPASASNHQYLPPLISRRGRKAGQA